MMVPHIYNVIILCLLSVVCAFPTGQQHWAGSDIIPPQYDVIITSEATYQPDDEPAINHRDDERAISHDYTNKNMLIHKDNSLGDIEPTGGHEQVSDMPSWKVLKAHFPDIMPGNHGPKPIARWRGRMGGERPWEIQNHVSGSSNEGGSRRKRKSKLSMQLSMSVLRDMLRVNSKYKQNKSLSKLNAIG